MFKRHDAAYDAWILGGRAKQGGGVGDAGRVDWWGGAGGGQGGSKDARR